MNRDQSGRRDGPDGRHKWPSDGNRVRFLLRGEEETLQAISAGMPLPELLNRICSALDCEIGNVVSLVSLLDEDEAEFEAMAKNAKRLGLHRFCSMGVIAKNRELLGILEMYSCKPCSPAPQDLYVIERAACLAAMAIERGNGALEDRESAIVEMRLIRRLVPDSSETLN